MSLTAAVKKLLCGLMVRQRILLYLSPGWISFFPVFFATFNTLS